MGQTGKNSVRAYVFRFALELGHRVMMSALRICANRRLMHRSENHLRLMVAAQRGRALPGLRGEVAASMDAA